MILSPREKKVAAAFLVFQILLIAVVTFHQVSGSRNFTLLKVWVKLVPVSLTAFSAADSGGRFPVLRSMDRDRLDVLKDSDPLQFVFKPGSR